MCSVVLGADVLWIWVRMWCRAQQSMYDCQARQNYPVNPVGPAGRSAAQERLRVIVPAGLSMHVTSLMKSSRATGRHGEPEGLLRWAGAPTHILKL